MHEISIGNLKWSAKNANFPWLWGPSRGVNMISQYWHKVPAHTFTFVLVESMKAPSGTKTLNNQ